MANTTKDTGPARIGLTIRDSGPHWPEPPRPPPGAPNILLILFDDAGFSDFGCYGSPIRTPTIDRLAAEGLLLTGFHTTAMCSTTRTALLTGRNHHSAGVGSLANFDSGYPGYRGKIAKEAGTLAEMLRPHGYRSYMLGKWHVTPLTESGSTGPFDGWPLGRGFDRYYGFMDAATDQYTPALVRDNSPIPPPRTPEGGYHLTEDLVDQSIAFLAGHVAERPETPWLLWLALGAVHAPHQAPADIIRGYDAVFAEGWDVERERRLVRQKALGVVPPDTVLPPRNDDVRPWDAHGPDERRFLTRLQSAFAGMLDHADRHLARLVGFLETAGLREDTIILVLSDNGGSQEGGPMGGVNLLGPRNLRAEPFVEKLARLDDIGGPGTYANYPLGWGMASNTPLKRYKQNTHGGGIRDPLVISWPRGLAARGETRHQFAHACDLAPTLLELVGVAPPDQVNGVAQMPIEGVSFAAALRDPAAPSKDRPQYFEMFGHRGIVHQGWKAVAYHPPETPFENDRWELYHLAEDFSESRDLAAKHPEKLKELVALWWREAERCQVLPLDDRFRQRFAENAARFHGRRTRYVFHAGIGHVPTEVAPDLRSRGYRIEAHADFGAADSGVLIAHGDATSGYSLYLRDGRLVHDMNIGGEHVVLAADRTVPPGEHVVGVVARRLAREAKPTMATGPGLTEFTLTIDGVPAGRLETRLGFFNFIAWAGLDIGCDRGSPVSHYAAPNPFTGRLRKVVVTMEDDQVLDGDSLGAATLARE
ncbi:MAG: arylsulfatase [Acetobacteraceae bacterium]|nr:arylsulfatase [Acetobacteraceae bacterium]